MSLEDPLRGGAGVRAEGCERIVGGQSTSLIPTLTLTRQEREDGFIFIETESSFPMH